MRVKFSRIILLAVALALPLLQASAHHGNEFISQALEASAAEVQIAKLAANKATDPKVKEFARMLAADHTQTFNQLQGLQDARMRASNSTTGQTKTTTKANPDNVQLTREHQRTLSELNKLSGAPFDARFIDIMVREHRDSIKMFEDQSRAHNYNSSAVDTTGRQKPSVPDTAADFAMDRDTANFATQTLPSLRNHLLTAEGIQKELRAKNK